MNPKICFPYRPQLNDLKPFCFFIEADEETTRKWLDRRAPECNVSLETIKLTPDHNFIGTWTRVDVLTFEDLQRCQQAWDPLQTTHFDFPAACLGALPGFLVFLTALKGGFSHLLLLGLVVWVVGATLAGLSIGWLKFVQRRQEEDHQTNKTGVSVPSGMIRFST